MKWQWPKNVSFCYVSNSKLSRGNDACDRDRTCGSQDTISLSRFTYTQLYEINMWRESSLKNPKEGGNILRVLMSRIQLTPQYFKWASLVRLISLKGLCPFYPHLRHRNWRGGGVVGAPSGCSPAPRRHVPVIKEISAPSLPTCYNQNPLSFPAPLIVHKRSTKKIGLRYMYLAWTHHPWRAPPRSPPRWCRPTWATRAGNRGAARRPGWRAAGPSGRRCRNLRGKRGANWRGIHTASHF